MFGNVIYYDRKKIDEYKSIIKGERNLEVNEYEVSNDKSMQIGGKVLGADAKASKTYKAKIQESLIFNCNEFENLLDGREDYFDYTQSSDYEFITMRRGTIIKLEGNFKVPEEFDFTQMIDKFKPMIVESLMSDINDKSEEVAMKIFFQTSDPKIPVLFVFDEQLICSKLISSNMLVKYEELEEYEETEVSIIARITSSNTVNENKAFYDPLKDFMTLNRTMRRNMDGRTDGLNELFVDKKYKTLEILAIYQ